MDDLLTWPGRRAAWWAFTAAAAAVASFYAGWTYRLPAAYALGSLFLVSAAGLWARRGWARQLCACGYLVPAALACHRLAQGGQSPVLLAGAVALIVSAWIVWTADLSIGSAPVPRRELPPQSLPQAPPLSLVALLPERRRLDLGSLARLAGQAWKTYVSATEDPDEESCVAGESPHFLIAHRGQTFAVQNFDRPYSTDLAAATGDPRTRQAIERHRAWLSVDRMDPGTDENERRQSYALVGRLLAELISADCLALYCPETGACHVYDESFARRLRAGQPFEGSRSGPHTPLSADESRLQSAESEALRRWPEFLAAFDARTRDQRFSVKALLTNGGHSETLWLDVTAIEGDLIFGVLDNAAALLPLRPGDRVRVARADLRDWIFTRHGQTHGGFTISQLHGQAHAQ